MKKFARTVSFVALLCLCCCFSTFGSVKAYAYNNEWHLYNRHEDTFHGDSIQSIIDSTVKMSYIEDGGFYRYEFTSSSPKSYSNLFFGSSTFNFYYPYEPELYDYYAVGFLSINMPNVNTSLNSSFDISDIFLYEFNADGSYNRINTNADINFSSNANSFIYNFTFPLTSNYDLSVLEFVFNPILDYKNRSDVVEEYCVAVLAVSKDTSSDEVNAIVNAINNQTATLDGSIGQASDDIQQSIEDQYGGDPSEEIDVDSIISDYEEKMGVLTFGTETTLQMLELFSPENAGEAYIRVPGWSMDIQGETYNVWNEYIFYFSSIEEWIPLLVRLMRTFNVTMFYIAILSYINKVYERNFLSK